MADIEASDFEATEETKSLFPKLSEMVDDAAFRLADDFLEAGQSVSESGSIVAHMFIRAAWKVAACSVMADGKEPNKDKFRAAVNSALEEIAFKETGEPE